ncbi:hypothetical protein M2298_002042 [Brevibacillus sp. 1238]|nr:hypothetical protein [Brevibacillus sp. 1238]
MLHSLKGVFFMGAANVAPYIFVENNLCQCRHNWCTIKTPIVNFLSYPLMERRVR